MLLLHFLDNPRYILTLCGIYFSTVLFIQAALTLIIKLYKTISINYHPKHNITLLSSIAHRLFNILTAEMVNDLIHTQKRKPKNTLLKSKSLDNFSDTSTTLINHSTGITSPPHFYTKRPNKLQVPKFILFPKKHHFSHPKTALQTSTLPLSSEQYPSLPNYSTKHSHPNDNLATPHDTLTNAPVTSNTDTPIKIYSRVNYPFPPLELPLELHFSLFANSLLEHFSTPS